jgi:glutamyl-tRNA reductase
MYLMDLLIVGINHNTAPIALREKVAFAADQLNDALLNLKSSQSLDELAILSTCNRTEIYAIKQGLVQGDALKENIINWLAEFHGLNSQSFSDCLYSSYGQNAVRHIIRVAAGLDSMVLGESQILGQLKDCFGSAQALHVMGKELNRLSQNTYRIAKQIRTETEIGKNSVSVASTAVVMASQLFADLKTCNVLLIGAGETIALVGRHLKSNGVKKIVIANRTVENAKMIAGELGADVIPLSELGKNLANADILIASTGSQFPILGKGIVESAIKTRRHKPIFMVDLAVPRDIETEVNELRDIYLYTLDDLQNIIKQNQSARQDAANQAEIIIDQAVKDFESHDQSLGAVDTLVKFRQKHELIKSAELDKALKRLENGDPPEEVLANFANQLTNKMIHIPSVQIKQAKVEGREDILDTISTLFQLKGNSGSDER